MFASALVAVDLSPAEQPILDCIPDLMNWGVNTVTLVHVIQLGFNRFVSYGHEDDYHAWLEKGAAPLREAGLEVSVMVRNSGGSVADQVLEAAAEVDADLIVIGSRGHTRLRSLFLGSVAREVIHKATRPVLLEWVEPGSEESRRFDAVCTHTLDHVLLATDLSKYASAAERIFAGLAPRALQADILTVLTPSALTTIPAWPLMVNAALEDMRKRLPVQAAQVSLLMQEGKPSESISEVAANRTCTLIIVGKQGDGQHVSKIIGSTAARICETARRPV
ncbi:MAG: universal stress protein, partial [Gammaproteobacteria bacterium]|nr:universal stress protein [Gammaproteobacteria bacterium]